MKKLLLVCLLALGASTMSFAQGQRGGGTPEQSLERLKTQITGITADQSTKLMTIYTAQVKSRDSLRTALNGDNAAYGEKWMPIRTAYSAKIKAVLTPEQAKAFDAIPQGRGPGQGGGAPRP